MESRGESAKAADSIRAAEVCAGVKPGEIVIFDHAYVDFIHLGVFNGMGPLGDPQQGVALFSGS